MGSKQTIMKNTIVTSTEQELYHVHSEWHAYVQKHHKARVLGGNISFIYRFEHTWNFAGHKKHVRWCAQQKPHYYNLKAASRTQVTHIFTDTENVQTRTFPFFPFQK